MSQNIYENHNSQSFFVMAWVSFVVSFGGMLAGIVYLDVDLQTKGFFAMTFLFSVSACFTLAKVTRDKHESNKIVNKVETAKTEKFLSENLPI